MSSPSPTLLKSIEFYQKPHTMDDTPKYEKPNAYDEEPPVVITASRHGSRSSRMTIDSFASRYFQRKKDVAEVIVADTVNVTQGECYSPNTPIKSPPLSPKSPNSFRRDRSVYDSQLDYQHITSFILSQSTPTTQMSFGHHHEDDACSTLPSYYVLPSSPANSITGIDTDTLKNNASSTDVAAATAALLSNNSGILSSFFLLPNKRKTTTANTLVNTNTNVNNNTIVYSFKKASILKPHQHYIYLHVDHSQEEGDDEEIMVYRKIQPYSYTWGLKSMLYSNRNDGQGIKVAEARRRAFQKEIFIEAADYDNSEVDDITQPHISNIKSFPATNNIHCQNLVKKSQSNILFEYEIWFHGSRMRWKRPSLLSNDFTCEVKLTRQETRLLLLEQQKKAANVNNKKQKSKGKKIKSTVSGYVTRTEDNEFIDSDSDNDEDDHDNHTHKTCRRWKLIAEFHSHSLSYLDRDLGKLSIDLDILNQVEKERCDLLEANIVMTCSTLIDLIRDVMGKP